MARWKVTLYLTDDCGEHRTKVECDTPPAWWVEEGNDPEDYDGVEEGWCYLPVPEGELNTESDARSWMNVLLTYGDKHQSAGFTDRSIERVN